MTVLDSVYNEIGERVAFGKTGVLWQSTNKHRLLSYDECPNGKILGPEGNVIAKFSGGLVFAVDGDRIGEFQGSALLVDSKKVGMCRGNEGVKSAAIVAFSKGWFE